MTILLMSLLLAGLVEATGADFQTQDSGDVFEKAGAIAAYARERLEAAATGAELPEPPVIFADKRALTLALSTTLAANALLIGVALGVTRQGPGGLARRLGLTGWRVRGLWRPALAVVGCYAMIIVYNVIVDALGIDALQPESTVPFEVARERLTLALAGVAVIVAAPLAEEVFYRGLIFGGLQRWGFWPAAIVSGAVFSGAHLQVGLLIPFFLIGVTLAWLFWRRGNLWESVAFHALFNAASFAILAVTEA